jgi:phasin family protein
MITMAKTKTAGDKVNDAAQGFETAFTTGTDALKAGFEKATKSYDQFLGYTKDTVDAYVLSATVAGKGAETFNSEVYAFSKQSIEDSVAAAKALFATKSIHEAFALQTDYAKSAFDAYVSEITKLSELVASTTKSALEPIQGRVEAFVDVVQSTRAA